MYAYKCGQKGYIKGVDVRGHLPVVDLGGCKDGMRGTVRVGRKAP